VPLEQQPVTTKKRSSWEGMSREKKMKRKEKGGPEKVGVGWGQVPVEGS